MFITIATIINKLVNFNTNWFNLIYLITLVNTTMLIEQFD